ncbi:hypothetical protein [Sphingopyxis sp.]|uniref:hypothetical protein n=1 Tax=Sphingopyxis sp. TaxID=1908224 RepID=UPI003D127949
MEQHSLYVIGGADDEQIMIVQDLVGENCRLTCTVRGEIHHVEAPDYFSALQRIRKRALEPKGLIPFCYGASLKVWPSAMSRDMGKGLKAYKIETGAQATELVGIFEEGPDIIPASVAMQEEFSREWIESLRKLIR